MLATEETAIGSVGGGCVEADVVALARQAFFDKTPIIPRFRWKRAESQERSWTPFTRPSASTSARARRHIAPQSLA